MEDKEIILVTGGTGYLGSRMVHKFVSQGHHVVVLKRASSDISRLSDIRDSVQFYDIENGEMGAALNLADFSMVFHAATSYGRKGETLTEIEKANVLMPLELLEHSINTNVRLFVHTGTSLDPLVSAYALSKRNFTNWGRNISSSNDIKFLELKLEHFFGPGEDSSKFITYLAQECIKNTPNIPLTFGDQRRDFLYIDDTITAIDYLISDVGNKEYGYYEYGVGRGNTVTIKSIAKKVKNISKSSSNLDFGAIPYRDNEEMESKAEIDHLKKIGWQPSTTIDHGLEILIGYEKNKIQHS